MILVDTSVWIDHLRKGIPTLAEALEREDVLTHPFIIGEMACGRIRARSEVLQVLSALPSGAVAKDVEMLPFIEDHRLMAKGIGYIDIHLLASVMLTEAAQFWTRDRRLAAVAAELRIAFENG